MFLAKMTSLNFATSYTTIWCNDQERTHKAGWQERRFWVCETKEYLEHFDGWYFHFEIIAIVKIIVENRINVYQVPGYFYIHIDLRFKSVTLQHGRHQMATESYANAAEAS